MSRLSRDGMMLSFSPLRPWHMVSSAFSVICVSACLGLVVLFPKRDVLFRLVASCWIQVVDRQRFSYIQQGYTGIRLQLH